MVNLLEVGGSLGVQVDDGRAAEVVVAVDQMARNDALLALNELLAEILNLGLSLNVDEVGRRQPLLDLLRVDLLLEADGEDGVAAAFKDLGHVSHGALDFLVEVVGAPRVTHQEVLADEPGAAEVVGNRDLVAGDLIDFQVRDAREVLTDGHLLLVPQRLAVLDSLSFGTFSLSTINGGSEDVRGTLDEHLGDLLV